MFFPEWILGQIWQAKIQVWIGESFLDLGSGTGRALLAAALAFPSLSCCAGEKRSEYAARNLCSF